MLLHRPDPDQVTLQVSAHNVDGTPKTALSSAKVRVYHMNGTAEIEDLAPVDLSQVGTSNTWRYVWTPPSLSADVYYAEYSLIDNDGAHFVDFENIVVLDIAENAVLTGVAGDTAFIKKIEKNRKRILNNQLIIYDDDGTTEWLKWDLFDVNGIPTNGVKVYDTVPV